MGFKEKLREEMEFKNILGKEIAAQINISYSTFLSYIDSRGVLPNVETAVKIANLLGVSVEYLVTENNNDKDYSEEILISNFRTLSDDNKTKLLKISEILK